VISELFQRAAAGEAWADLGRWLESSRVRTAYDNPRWEGRAVKATVRNRVYLGEARHGEFVNADAHQALTDGVTFRRADRRGRLNQPRGHDPALLSGLIRCAGCRHVMQSEWRRGCHRYKCRRNYPGGLCPSPSHISDSGGVLHVHVERAFFEKVGELVLVPSAETDGRLSGLEQDAAQARAAFEIWRDLGASEMVQLGASDYAAGLAARQAALQEAEAALFAERDQLSNPLPLAPVELREVWPSLTILERRELLAQVVDAIFVRCANRRGRGVQPESRLHICWRDEAPTDLPSRARSGPAAVPLRSFSFPGTGADQL
jgi:hypothetical protein